MDSNFSVKQSGSFPSRGTILDFIILTSQIKLPRKDIERLSEEKEVSPEQYDKILCEAIDQIITHFFKIPTQKSSGIRQALYSFIAFYPHFVRYLGRARISQKLLDYLLLKDLFIPLFADISSKFLDEHRLVLLEILPASDETAQQKLFHYLEKITQPKEGIKRYLHQKLDAQEGDTKSYDSIRHNLDNWINTDTKMELESIHQVIELIFDDIKISITREHIANLFICAHMIQKAYDFCKDTYSEEQVQSLFDHLTLLIQFYNEERNWSFIVPNYDPNDLKQVMHVYLEKSKSWFDPYNAQHVFILKKQCFDHIQMHYLPQHLYKTFLEHIDPTIINRDFYFDSYFVFIQDVLYLSPSQMNPKQIIEEGLQRNGILYRLSDETAFKYMPIFLPMPYFNKRLPQKHYKNLQNEYLEFGQEYLSKTENLSLKQWKQNLAFFLDGNVKGIADYLMRCVYFNMMLNKQFLKEDQAIYEEIFSELENSRYDVDDKDPNICLLKAKFFAFSNTPQKALDYYKTTIMSGKHQIGDKLVEAIAEGMLVAGKCEGKREWNFFEKEMMIANIEWREIKKIYRNERSETWVYIFGVDEVITDLNTLSQMFDSYFLIENNGHI